MTTSDMAVLQQKIRDATRAPEPGEGVGTVITSKDSQIDTMSIAELTSANYTYIWNAKTGERSLTNMNMLPTQLQKKNSDGSFVFTTIDLGIVPKRGNLKCLLHADSPERKHYDSLGLPVCRKSNLTSPFQVRRHMMNRHKVEWATIEQERVDQERHDQEMRDKALVAALSDRETRKKRV